MKISLLNFMIICANTVELCGNSAGYNLCSRSLYHSKWPNSNGFMASLGRMSALRFKRFYWVILKTFPKLVIVWYSALRRRARVSITTVSII